MEPNVSNTLQHFGVMKAINSERNGTMHDKMTMAKKLGYPFFSWNDRVYSTDKIVDTGVTLGWVLDK